VAAFSDARMKISAGPVLSGTVSCTGSRGCRYASTDTKTHAVALASYIDERFTIVQPLNLHVTGCPHSCAQHYIGDIGLLGVKVDGEEGYQVSLGGGSDQDQGLARELIPAIRYDQLPPVMDRLFSAFQSRRTSEQENFLSFTRRHSIEELRAFALPAREEK
jgi:ferredoxin-nitrite reductase